MTREERLCNPGGIKRSQDHWIGQTADQPDSVFVKFITPEYGIRAIVKTLETYINRDGVHTVAEAIMRWAPPTENDTDAYISDVCLRCGARPTSALIPNSVAMVKAIIIHENGICIYPDSLIAKGTLLA